MRVLAFSARSPPTHQAEILSQPDNIGKLVAELKTEHEPKLLIVLQWTGNFRGMLSSQGPKNTDFTKYEHENGCFLSKDEAQAAQTRLDAFMREVLIPIAVETNAVVVCDAVREIELSASFLRQVALQRPRFSGKLPFSIVAVTDEIHSFYANAFDKPKDGKNDKPKDENCHWRKVQRDSPTWTRRDLEIHQLTEAKTEIGNFFPRYDMSPDAPFVIMTDGIDAKAKKCLERGPANTLLTSLIRQLSDTLPSIAFRTGYANAKSLATEGAMSVVRTLDALNAGTPVVLLDVRERKGIPEPTRQQMIDRAKDDYLQLCSDLEKKGTMDWFNVCAIAWFHDVLFGDGDSRTTSVLLGGPRYLAFQRPQAIQEALRSLELKSKEVHCNEFGGTHKKEPATHAQVEDVAHFIANRMLNSIIARSIKWEPLEEKATEEAIGRDLGKEGNGKLASLLSLRSESKGDIKFTCDEWKTFGIRGDLQTHDFIQVGDKRFQPKACGREPDLGKLFSQLREERAAAAQMYQMLLEHERLHSANVADIDGVKELVQVLVTSDRLPKHNSKQALQLLQQAWREHDVAMWLSRRYMRLADVLYAVILLVGVATVTCTTVFAHNLHLASGYSEHIIFGLSMVNTAVILAVKYFNPTVRGNQLRSAASDLESIIWRFRTRHGVFAVTREGPLRKPTKALQDAMAAWHTRVVGGTDLLRTAMERKYPSSVFTHCQYDGKLDQHAEIKAIFDLDDKIKKLKQKVQARKLSVLQVLAEPNTASLAHDTSREEDRDLEAGLRINEERLGLVWKCVGTKRPSTGTEISNPKLRMALKKTVKPKVAIIKTCASAIKSSLARLYLFRRETGVEDEDEDEKAGSENMHDLIEFSEEEWASFEIREIDESGLFGWKWENAGDKKFIAKQKLTQIKNPEVAGALARQCFRWEKIDKLPTKGRQLQLSGDKPELKKALNEHMLALGQPTSPSRKLGSMRPLPKVSSTKATTSALRRDDVIEIPNGAEIPFEKFESHLQNAENHEAHKRGSKKDQLFDWLDSDSYIHVDENVYFKPKVVENHCVLTQSTWNKTRHLSHTSIIRVGPVYFKPTLVYLLHEDYYVHAGSKFFKPVNEGDQLNELIETRLDKDLLVDDHHAPVCPDHYVELRLRKMRRIFQKKIPYLHARMSFWELILSICTIASSVLSYIGTTSHFVAVSSGTAAAVTSWVSYNDLLRKIELYSNVVRAINDLIWWWKSLDDIERANTVTINKLIETGEQILAAERLAWVAAKQDDKGTEEGSGSEAGGLSKTSVRGRESLRRSRVTPEA